LNENGLFPAWNGHDLLLNLPAFAQALLDEAATLFLNGEPETARLILRDLVNATRGFEQFATLTAKPSKSQLPVVGA
jgi:hypothetical protein